MLPLFCITVSGITQDARSYYENGYQYFSQGDYQKAEESYQKAIELNPDFEDAHYWLGKVYRQTGQHTQAVPQWIEVLRINPRNPYAFRYLNESFRSTPRIQNGKAQDFYEESLKILKITKEEYFLNENNYNITELLQIAPYFRKALELEDDFIPAYYWLGELYKILSKKISWQYTSMAINNFENVIKIEEEKTPITLTRPAEYWYTYQELADIYQSLGLNERKDNLLLRLHEIKAKAYEKILAKSDFTDLGYPDAVEIVKEQDKISERWKYTEEGIVLRVINAEVVGKE